MSEKKREIGPVTTSATAGMTLSGAVALVLHWFLTTVVGLDMSMEIALAMSILIMAAGTLLGGWLVRPGNGDRRAE